MSDQPSPTPEKVLFSGQRFRIHQVSSELPDGTRIEKQIIRHPGAVVILPLLDPDHVLMIRNYRYSVARTLLELPAGTREPDETPAETATRELNEETGYIAGNLQFIQSFYAAPGCGDEQMFLFVATDLQRSSPNRETGEQIENEVLPWTEVEAQLDQGAIQDAKSLIGLLYGLRRRQQAR
ncbi:NUDIX hydrolase [Roseimaritima ulvae]|uniref:GDP-mannose pyrophosphatase n=1 Tax=Roseimaritima ulvae TaxID=980254 RepID=A0A5B9QIQ4_9BACT|nr:NUDIX hydrolase [Roseimaritima ulvae]QEG38987.1 ADP-ribose pyrophosphatase [Roseimaritima ulvae]